MARPLGDGRRIVMFIEFDIALGDQADFVQFHISAVVCDPESSVSNSHLGI